MSKEKNKLCGAVWSKTTDTSFARCSRGNKLQIRKQRIDEKFQLKKTFIKKLKWKKIHKN